ncbi:DUF1266 domain-containing protein [Anaerofilum sp. BX8]|uniref:DUF1266 domain-containing protein n=1 Tax=Anaerofilum hominis TaxID=2763016 RepID=A0A923L298_9FIRM|nr:DUF1266 domain-containing protein [Anaerofilum hominis]MBC5582521.1 DUF1266 domain-containing protein [Anaerofilum hominis]
MTRRLFSGALCALLLFAALTCALPAAAAEGPLTEDALSSMEAAASADPLAADFQALWSGLFSMAQLASGDGWRGQHPQEAAAFDALAARADLLCLSAEDAISARYEASYDVSTYLDGPALWLARSLWQLARLDGAAANNSAYKDHMGRAGFLYQGCVTQYGSANLALVPQVELDFDFLLAYCAYSGQVDGNGRGLINEMLGWEWEAEARPFTDFYEAHAAEIDELLADTGASAAGHPDRGRYWVDGNPRESGEIVFDDGPPYVALEQYLRFFGGEERTNYSVPAAARAVCWLLCGDEIKASEKELLLNGEKMELSAPPFLEGGLLYVTLYDADYLAFALADQQTPEGEKAPKDGGPGGGEVYVLRPYLGQQPPTEQQLLFLEGIGAGINLQNLIARGAGLSPADAPALCEEQLSGWAGLARGTANSLYAQSILEQSWNVRSPEEVYSNYEWLLSEGHRGKFRSAAQEDGVPGWFLLKWGSALDQNSFLAWDLARAVQLCQWGCCAGYLAPQQAVAMAFEAARQLQAAFPSWQAFADDYLMGYDAFLAQDADKDDFYGLRRPILEALYADGAYRGVGWELELPAAQDGPAAPPALSAPGAPALPPRADLMRSAALAGLGLLLATLAAGAGALIWVLLRNEKRRAAAARRPGGPS